MLGETTVCLLCNGSRSQASFGGGGLRGRWWKGSHIFLFSSLCKSCLCNLVFLLSSLTVLVLLGWYLFLFFIFSPVVPSVLPMFTSVHRHLFGNSLCVYGKEGCALTQGSWGENWDYSTILLWQERRKGRREAVFHPSDLLLVDKECLPSDDFCCLTLNWYAFYVQYCWILSALKHFNVTGLCLPKLKVLSFLKLCCSND